MVLSQTHGASKWLLVIGSSLFALVIAEALVRLLLPRPGFEAFPAADYGVLIRDTVRGYAYAPMLHRNIATSDYRYEFATNAMGMRDSAIEPVLPKGPRVLAVGDSYTQGLGVEGLEAWPGQLQGLMPAGRVYNAGVSGYSLRQMRLTAQLLVPRVKPHLIVVGLYVAGYYRLNNPFVIIPGGASPVSRHVASRARLVPEGILQAEFNNPWLRELTFWADQHWYFAGHLLHAVSAAWRNIDRAPAIPEGESLTLRMMPMLRELGMFQRYADSIQTPLAVLLINFQEIDGSFAPEQREMNSIVARFAAQHDICVVNPIIALASAAAGRPTLRFLHDKHWSATAHAVAAETLAAALHSPTPTCRRAGSALVARSGGHW